MSLCPPFSDPALKPAKKHKPQKVFQCAGYGDCAMTFTRGEHLARHIRKHTGERPYQCQCGRMFSRLDNLRQHAQTVHANDSNPQIRPKPRPHPLVLPRTDHYTSPPISPSSQSHPSAHLYWAAAPSPPLTADLPPSPALLLPRLDLSRRSSLAHIFDDDDDKVNRRRTWHCNDRVEFLHPDRRLPSIASLFGNDPPDSALRPAQGILHHRRPSVAPADTPRRPSVAPADTPRRYSLPVRPIPRPIPRGSVSSNASSPLATPEDPEQQPRRDILPPPYVTNRKRGSVSIAELCQPTATRLRIADDAEETPQSKMDVLVQASLLQQARRT